MNEVSTHFNTFQPYISTVDDPGAKMTICTLEMRILKFREVAPLSRPSSKWWGRHFSPDLLTQNPVYFSSTPLPFAGLNNCALGDCPTSPQPVLQTAARKVPPCFELHHGSLLPSPKVRSKTLRTSLAPVLLLWQSPIHLVSLLLAPLS